MPVSVTTIAPKCDLTRLERVKAELGLTVTTYDDLIRRLISQASASIASYCGRTFERQVYSETCPAYGGLELQLTHAPLISVSSVLWDSTTTITDYSIGDRNEGYLYRRYGWEWSAQWSPTLSRQEWPMYGQPRPGREEPIVTVAYTAGHILPPQNLEGVSTVSASVDDNSFNDSGSGFPSLSIAGDVIEVSGFSNAANNGRFVLSGTPTTAKIVVDATLVTETAKPGTNVIFQNRPDCRRFDDVEKAAIECVKSLYFARDEAPSIVEKQFAAARVRYSEQAQAQPLGVPPICVGLLRPWRRRR